MKAAVCYRFDEPLSVEDVTIDPPRRGEVSVRIAATAICHSDIHFIRGERAATPPIVVGHESAGVVEGVGEGVTLTKPGDRVILSLLRSCGRCFYCTLGSPYLCEGTFALDAETRLHNRRGVPLRDGGLCASAFAEYAVAIARYVVPVPDGISSVDAAPLSCAGLTTYKALKVASVQPAEQVGVFGIGGLGHLAVQYARLMGGVVTAVDIDEDQIRNNSYAQETILGDIQTLRFPPDSFDFIICYNVLEHVPYVEAALAGFFQSLQFTATQAMSYADVGQPQMSTATSIAGMTQQLSRGFGISVVAVVLNLSMAWRGAASLGTPDFMIAFGSAAVMALLIYEHGLVKANDLSRVNAAFFTVNGYVSVLFFAFWAADILLHRTYL